MIKMYLNTFLSIPKIVILCLLLPTTIETTELDTSFMCEDPVDYKQTKKHVRNWASVS